MGFWDVITDIVEAATPWSVAEAEAAVAEPAQEEVRTVATHPPCRT